MLPQKFFLNLGAMRLFLRPFLCQYDACRRPEDRVSHECHSAHCVVHHWCRLSDPVRLSAESHTSFHRLGLQDYSFSCKNRKLLEGKLA